MKIVKNNKAKYELTEIQFVPIKPVNGLVGFVSFVLNDCLYLGSIGVMTKMPNGYRLVYQTRNTSGNSINVFHPINKEFAVMVELQVLPSIEEVLNQTNDRYNSNFVRR